jgi:L-lysine 2,3-aminomutase
MQHKYRETVLYFPSQSQTCHSYCTYCFRWAQFVGDADLRFAAPTPQKLITYLSEHPAVSDVLVTGGDLMVMSTPRLRNHLEPLLAVDTLHTIRIDTKSVAYWPYRFVTDQDADDLLRLFEQVIASGRNLAVPMVARVNNDASTWSELWRTELAAGAVPYYMFVERDTGPHDYFKVPLVKAVEIFHTAYQTLPGLARTVRGPVMSTTPGKVTVDGVEETPQGRFFQLHMLQARNPALVGRPFRAHYNPSAAWLDALQLDNSTPADIATALTGPA